MPEAIQSIVPTESSVGSPSTPLPAAAVDARLRAAARQLDLAEQDVVTWYAEMLRRRLYRDLGHSSMRQYATRVLGWSARRAADFARLASSLDTLPRIGRAVASGELGYTKAREVIKVASPETEQQWLEAATGSSRRELEEKVKRVQKKARQRRRSAPAAQAEMLPATNDAPLADAAPSTVSLRLTAEQRARYDALWQKLGRAPNADDLLEALAALIEERAGTSSHATDSEQVDSGDACPRGHGTPVQIHVHRCPECEAMHAGERALDRADRERVECDAAVSVPGQRNTTTIPPRTRREVLARDRHRCRAPGCDHMRFLEVHHLVPRSRGGTNDPSNLITLCSACHRLWHERGRPGCAARM
jgi:hypothetical protein